MISTDADAVIDWLLDADPSIRWQVMRDLTETRAEIVAADDGGELGARDLERNAPVVREATREEALISPTVSGYRSATLGLGVLVGFGCSLDGSGRT